MYISMKPLKINCQKHEIGSLVLSSRCMTKYRKTCSFLDAHFTERMKVVEHLLKKAMMKTHYVVGTNWNCLLVPITYVT